MVENGTIFKTRTNDLFISYNKLKQNQKSKCTYIEVHTCVLLVPGVLGKGLEKQTKQLNTKEENKLKL